MEDWLASIESSTRQSLRNEEDVCWRILKQSADIQNEKNQQAIGLLEQSEGERRHYMRREEQVSFNAIVFCENNVLISIAQTKQRMSSQTPQSPKNQQQITKSSPSELEQSETERRYFLRREEQVSFNAIVFCEHNVLMTIAQMKQRFLNGDTHEKNVNQQQQQIAISPNVFFSCEQTSRTEIENAEKSYRDALERVFTVESVMCIWCEVYPGGVEDRGPQNPALFSSPQLLFHYEQIIRKEIHAVEVLCRDALEKVFTVQCVMCVWCDAFPNTIPPQQSVWEASSSPRTTESWMTTEDHFRRALVAVEDSERSSITLLHLAQRWSRCHSFHQKVNSMNVNDVWGELQIDTLRDVVYELEHAERNCLASELFWKSALLHMRAKTEHNNEQRQISDSENFIGLEFMACIAEQIKMPKQSLVAYLCDTAADETLFSIPPDFKSTGSSGDAIANIEIANLITKTMSDIEDGAGKIQLSHARGMDAILRIESKQAKGIPETTRAQPPSNSANTNGIEMDLSVVHMVDDVFENMRHVMEKQTRLQQAASECARGIEERVSRVPSPSPPRVRAPSASQASEGSNGMLMESSSIQFSPDRSITSGNVLLDTLVTDVSTALRKINVSTTATKLSEEIHRLRAELLSVREEVVQLRLKLALEANQNPQPEQNAQQQQSQSTRSLRKTIKSRNTLDMLEEGNKALTERVQGAQRLLEESVRRNNEISELMENTSRLSYSMSPGSPVLATSFQEFQRTMS